MDTESISTQDKQVTVDVPADRVAEFYAFYARFLAGGTRGRGGPHRGQRHGHGHGCRGRHARSGAERTDEAVRTV